MDPSTVVLLGAAALVYVMWKSPSGFPRGMRAYPFSTNYGVKPFDDYEAVHGTGSRDYMARLHYDYKKAGQDYRFHQLYGGDYYNAYDNMGVQGHRTERAVY
jgi:hypothetical protein